MRNLQNHKVHVNRKKLIETLQINRAQHEADYLEAVSLYKEVSKKKIEEAVQKAKASIDKLSGELCDNLVALKDDEISKQDIQQRIIDSRFTVVILDVPTSHVDEYDLAIKMFEWDVSASIQLSYADFRCFIEDNWDWKEDFTRMSTSYKAALAFKNDE